MSPRGPDRAFGWPVEWRKKAVHRFPSACARWATPSRSHPSRIYVTVNDKRAFDALRVRGYCRSQKNIEVYLNGRMIAKIDHVSGSVQAPLTDYAMQLIRAGENTVAVVTRHCDRWGKVKGDYSGAFGFGFRLDARKTGTEGE